MRFGTPRWGVDCETENDMPDARDAAKRRTKLDQLIEIEGFESEEALVAAAVGEGVSIGPYCVVGADASHAWFAVFCPGLGWVDFDPTNNLLPGEEHITVAFGRDYSDVSPVSGVITGGGAHRVQVSVDWTQVD